MSFCLVSSLHQLFLSFSPNSFETEIGTMYAMQVFFLQRFVKVLADNQNLAVHVSGMLVRFTDLCYADWIAGCDSLRKSRDAILKVA